MEYNTGELMHAKRYPKIVHQIQGGVVIAMPLEGIENYLAPIISPKNLLPDTQLMQYLTTLLAKRCTKSSTERVY